MPHSAIHPFLYDTHPLVVQDVLILMPTSNRSFNSKIIFICTPPFVRATWRRFFRPYLFTLFALSLFLSLSLFVSLFSISLEHFIEKEYKLNLLSQHAKLFCTRSLCQEKILFCVFFFMLCFLRLHQPLQYLHILKS